MILPTKYIPVEESLLGVGATILNLLGDATTISSLWERSRVNPNIGSYDRFVLGLDLLFMCEAINFSDGVVSKKQ
jgi:hypothetical protein